MAGDVPPPAVPGLTLRTFQPRDAPAVYALFAGGLLDYAGDAPQEMEAYIASSLADDLADIPFHYLARPEDHFWVAEVAGEVKGMVGVQGRSGGEAELRRMSVAGDSRRRGIGRALLGEVEEFCRRQGYREVRLTTVTLLQPAIALYRRAGYQLVGEEQYGEVTGQHYRKQL